jgi:MFS family permease
MEKKERWFLSYLPTNMAGGCFDSLLPIFIVLALAGTVGEVALVSVAASLAAVPSLIFWGRATDWMKWRKHFVVLGFLGRAIAYTAMGASVGTGSLLFANILMGLLASASTPAMSILILESFSKEVWSEKIGLFNKVAGIGNLAGIAMGSIWIAFMPGVFGLETSLRLLFLFNAVLALVGTWLAFLLVIEPDEKIARESLYEHILQIVRWAHERRRYLPERMYSFITLKHLRQVVDTHKKLEGYAGWFLSATFVYNVGAVAFFTIAPVFLINILGMDGSLVFALSFIQALASTFLFKYMGKYSDRKDKISLLFQAKCSRVLLMGLYVAAIPLTAFNAPVGVLFLLLVHLGLGIGWAIIADTQLPIAVGSGDGEHKGSHAGVFNAAVGMGAIAGGAMGGILATVIGFTTSIIICSVMIFASALILKFIVIPKARVQRKKVAHSPA